MKGAQLVGVNGEQVLSKLKLTQDTTINPFETLEVKGIVKTPNHYKCVNVVVDNLPEKKHCRDITAIQQIQTLKPGLNKILVVLRNLSCRTLKVRKGMEIANVEASNIVPTVGTPGLSENILEKGAGNGLKNNLLKSIPMAKEKRIEKDFGKSGFTGYRVLE